MRQNKTGNTSYDLIPVRLAASLLEFSVKMQFLLFIFLVNDVR